MLLSLSHFLDVRVESEHISETSTSNVWASISESAEYKVAKETEKYEQVKEEYVNTEKEAKALKEEVVDTKKEVEVLKEQVREAEDRAEQAELVYEMIKGEG